MLKSLSLCLYSSILGTLWLKIEQFWPFYDISIFSNGGHLGWRAWLSDTFERGPSKDYSRKVWSKLAQWFLRRRLKCEQLTTDDDDGRTKPDDKSSHGLWPGELKRTKKQTMVGKTIHRKLNIEQHELQSPLPAHVMLPLLKI